MADAPAIVFAFLERIARDRASGTVKTRADYCALYPGYEDVVGAEFDRLTDETAPNPPRIPDAVGEVLGPYQLVEELGRGGQGAVFRARDERLQRDVALKVLLGHGGASLLARERFQREAIVASRLDHPGICTILEVGEARGVAWVAMRLVPGDTLAKRIASIATPTSPAEWNARLEWIEDAAHALHAAHEAGVVHRDVKPGNLMVTPEGRVVVLDFGLARDLDPDTPSLTASGELHGTPAYMSPEQLATHRATIDRRTDVFSLGVTLYELVTGRRPFDASTREGLFRAIVSEDPPSLRSLVRDAPRDLDVVLATALAKDRDQRYSTAAALAADLRAVRESRPIAARRPSTFVRVARFVAREPAKAALMGGLVLALVVAAGAVGFLAARSREITEGRKELRRQEVDRAVVAAFAGWQAPPMTRSLDALLAEDPGLDLVRVTMVLGLFEAGRFDAVLAQPTEIADLDTRAAMTRVRAAALESLSQPDAAKLESAALDAPEHRAGSLEHFALGVLEEAKRQEDPMSLSRAWDHFRTARLLAPRAEFVFHYRCTIAALAAGADDAARESGDALVQMWPESAYAWFALGTIRGKLSGPKPALEALERAVQLEPDFPEAWLNIGVSHLILGDVERADASYRRGLEAVRGKRAPWHLPALWGRVLYTAKMYAPAVVVLEEAVGQNDALIPETKMLASSLRKAGRIADAIPLAERILARDPRDADGSKLLRLSLEQTGAVDAAIAECERRLGVAPDDAETAKELDRLRSLPATKP
ncbi:MAG: protein kinase [Planctomycetes bacterium]|nr:protein kinase [Planctomycetota bacterium]MCC7170334.1 protein kinase [Planctomycetota bacterium]